MTAFEFQEQIRTTGRYVTPRSHRRPRLPLALASPLFHIRLLGIFIRGNYLARFPDFETREWGNFCFRMLRLTESLGGEVEISGFEHVHRQKLPVVWVSNHVGSLETYLLPLVMASFSSLMIVLKESLAHYPIFGLVVRTIRPIRVHRKSAVEDLRKVLTEGTQGLREGRSVLIFPQGMRLPVFDPATFNSMGVKLAQRAGVAMVPVAVRADYLGIGRLHKDLVRVHTDRPVRIACGEPIPPGLSPREMQDAATAFIASKLAAWEQETGHRLVVPEARGAQSGEPVSPSSPDSLAMAAQSGTLGPL